MYISGFLSKCMVEEFLYGGGLIKEYRGLGTVTLGPYEEAIKTGIFGGIEEKSPGNYILLPGQSMMVINKRIQFIEKTVQASTDDNFPIEFKVKMGYQPKDATKLIKNAPVDLEIVLGDLVEAQARKAIYTLASLPQKKKGNLPEGMRKSFDSQDDLEKNLANYLNDTMNNWGLGLTQVRVSMVAPKEYSDLRYKLGASNMVIELARVEGELERIAGEYRTRIEAYRKETLGKINLDLYERFMNLTYDRRLQTFNELNDKVKRPQDLVAVLYLVMGPQGAANSPVNGKIESLLGYSATAEGVSDTAKKMGLTPYDLLYFETVKGSNLMITDPEYHRRSDLDKTLRNFGM
jgi:hypothetical protein